MPVSPAAGDSDRGDANPAPKRPKSSYLWAALLARIYNVFLLCPRCGTQMRIIAFVTDKASIDKILTHIGEPTTVPPISPARGPPSHEADLDQTSLHDPTEAEPPPEPHFDQTHSW